VGIPVGAYGEVGYRTNYGGGGGQYGYGGGRDSFSQGYGGDYAGSLQRDTLALEGIVGRLTAAEAATAALRGKLLQIAGPTRQGPQQTPQVATSGSELVRKKCGGCHQPGGKGGDSLALIDENGAWVEGLMGERAALVDSILSGKMPKQSTLTEDELRAMLAWFYQEEK